MKRSKISFLVNIGITVMVVANCFLAAKLFDAKEADVITEGFKNSYEVIPVEETFTEGDAGRTAHYLRVKTNTFEGFMRLAYANCIPSALPRTGFVAEQYGAVTGFSTPEALREARDQFDGCDFTRLIEVGAQSKDFLKKLFAREKYKLLGRGDNSEQSSAVIMFVLVEEENPDGIGTRERYLHEILIEEGLAYPLQMNHLGPQGETAEELYERALEAQDVARANQAGAFNHELDNEFFEPASTREMRINEDAYRGQRGFNQFLPEYLAQQDLAEMNEELRLREAALIKEQNYVAKLEEELIENQEEFTRRELKMHREKVKILKAEIQEILEEKERRAAEEEGSSLKTSTSGVPMDNPSGAPRGEGEGRLDDGVLEQEVEIEPVLIP